MNDPRLAQRMARIAKPAPAPAVSVRHARITDTHLGDSPPTVDLLIEDTWAVPGVRYCDAIDTPAENDEVMVWQYGPGRFYVASRPAT